MLKPAMAQAQECVLFDGRMVPIEGFRAFIYTPDGQSKVANSWDEYQEHISSGVWFGSKEEAQGKSKPKKNGKE
jgi:hypothetical protein